MIDLIVFLLLVIIFCFGLVVIVGAPYVPTKKSFATKVFSELYKLSKKDKIVDIGSGDGMVLRFAASIGARSVGYEINPILFLVSKYLARGNPLIVNRLSNFWSINLPMDTTVVYVFITTKDMKRLYKWLQVQTNRLGKPLTVISLGNHFNGIKPDKVVEPYNLYVFRPLQLH